MSLELDDLKSIWKGNRPFEAKPAEEIAAMLKGRSNSPIAKLKRSTWFELVFVLVTIIATLFYALRLPSGSLRWSLIATVVIFMVYCVYYFKKLRLLNSFDSSHQNIRENLEKLVKDLNTYLHFYKISYAVVFPAYLLLVLLFTAIERGAAPFFHQLTQPETILRLSALLVFIIIAVFISKWYLKKLYGTHLEALKELLKDINDSAAQGKD